MYNYQLILKRVLEHGVRWAPKQEIVYRDVMRYTYSDLYERVHKLANALENLGVKEGDKVAVLDWDSHRYLECYYAIPMMGAILHTVNVRLSAEDIVYTMNHAEDDVVLVYSDFVPLIESIKDKLDVSKFILLTDSEYQTDLTDVEYESMLKDSDAKYDFPDLDENTIATMSYTTGTTGRPKGVFFTHRQLVLHTFGLLTTFTSYDSKVKIGDKSISMRVGSGDVYMPLTPMFHVHAWGVPYMATVLGTKQVYPGRYDPQMILKLILEEKVTFSHCVPTILAMIVNAMPEGFTLPGWKMIIGGSKLNKGLAQRAYEKGIYVMAAYGMSETCPLLTAANLKPELSDEDDVMDYVIKTGFPAFLVDIRVVRSDWTDVRRDEKEMGEIVVRAPWLTQAYYKDEEKTKELWEGDWLHTGDIAVVDEYGYITIVDRIKDVIKSGGEWISSLTLENLASLHPAVLESAAIGVPDEKWGERPLLVVKLDEKMKGSVTEEDIRNHMMKFVEEGKITKWAVPDRVVFVDEIPKTSVGKINKRELKQMFS
jgi:fatty-acyl-CoA synthase